MAKFEGNELKNRESVLLAQVAWEFLTWHERTAKELTPELVALHDYVKPRLEHILRRRIK